MEQAINDQEEMLGFISESNNLFDAIFIDAIESKENINYYMNKK